MTIKEKHIWSVCKAARGCLRVFARLQVPLGQASVILASSESEMK